MNKRAVGAEYEKLCIDYLKKNNVIILDTNFRSRIGEIDIIGKDGDCIVFFEVKYRKNLRSGSAEASVTLKKQETISRVSDYYRLINGYDDGTSVRYDVMAVNDTEIKWYKNAFEYI